MNYYYTCNVCIERAAGKPVKRLSVNEYNELAAQFTVEVEHGVGEAPEVKCVCGASPMRRLLGITAGYVRGYGLADKRGAKNDMNLFQMVTGNDPYKEHRKPGAAADLTNKLRRNKEYNPRARSVFVR